MPVVRGPEPNENFFYVTNSLARDERLSLRARGVLLEILSHGPDWCPDAAEMSTRAKEGRDAIYAAFSELAAAGYLTRERYQTSGGKWATRTTFYASPQVAPTTDFQESVNQESVFQESVRPGQTQETAGRTDSWLTDCRSTRSYTKNRDEGKNKNLSSSRIRPATDAVGGDAAPTASGKLDLTGERREDVERLCLRLADAIEANGSRRPPVTKAWRDAARLLMDKDGMTESQVLKAINWCQNDEFWRCNILSMPTLRKQYDKLRLAAMRQNGNGNANKESPRKSTTDERVQQGLDVVEKLRRKRLEREAQGKVKEIEGERGRGGTPPDGGGSV